MEMPVEGTSNHTTCKAKTDSTDNRYASMGMQHKMDICKSFFRRGIVTRLLLTT